MLCNLGAILLRVRFLTLLTYITAFSTVLFGIMLDKSLGFSINLILAVKFMIVTLILTFAIYAIPRIIGKILVYFFCRSTTVDNPWV